MWRVCHTLSYLWINFLLWYLYMYHYTYHIGNVLRIVSSETREINQSQAVIHHDHIKLWEDLDYPGKIKIIKDNIFDQNDKVLNKSNECSLEADDVISKNFNLLWSHVSDILIHHQIVISNSSADRENNNIKEYECDNILQKKYIAHIIFFCNDCYLYSLHESSKKKMFIYR